MRFVLFVFEYDSRFICIFMCVVEGIQEFFAYCACSGIWNKCKYNLFGAETREKQKNGSKSKCRKTIRKKPHIKKGNKLLFRLSARLVVPLWITCKRIFSSSSNHIPTWNSACMRSSTKNAYHLKWFHYLFVNSNFCRSNKTMCERRMCLQNPIVNLDPHECDKSNTRLAILSCMLYYYFKQTNRSSATATETAKWNRAQTKEKKSNFQSNRSWLNFSTGSKIFFFSNGLASTISKSFRHSK